MPRPVNPVTTYRHHKPSGYAVVTVPQPGRRVRDVYLGPHNPPESKVEYGRILAQLRAGVAVSATGGSPIPPTDLTVNELLVKFLAHADGYYRHSTARPPASRPTTATPSASSAGCTGTRRRPSSARWP